MKAFLKQISLSLALLLLCSLLAIPAQAEEAEAQNISSFELLTDHSGVTLVGRLFDGHESWFSTAGEGSHITLESQSGIASIYLILNSPCGIYTVTNEDTGETVEFGQSDFIHQFLDLETAFGSVPTAVTFRFGNGGAQLTELYCFTSGKVPDFVQRWESPREGKTDLILFSTHCDDDQLFFAGMLPYYAGEMDYEVLVAYLTCHRQRSPWRQHEMLNGLYAVGVRTYPIMGDFSDLYCTSKNSAYGLHNVYGETEELLLGYVVEQLRRYKPLVAVGHDPVNGEYGHGQHMMYADLLCKALDAANDPAQYPELAERFGTWDVPKTYLHLWPENPIVMDWDQPLDSFDGMTAFQVTQKLGYPCHESQYKDFAWYLSYAGSAADIQAYSPRKFAFTAPRLGTMWQRTTSSRI